jgi:hypothetical protein
MDRRACYIARFQRATNLCGMPACVRPRGCESAGKNAEAGCTPSLIGFDPDRGRGCSDNIDGFRHVGAKRHQPCSGSVAVFARAGLNDR